MFMVIKINKTKFTMLSFLFYLEEVLLCIIVASKSLHVVAQVGMVFYSTYKPFFFFIHPLLNLWVIPIIELL
jgi:hypothetical protein